MVNSLLAVIVCREIDKTTFAGMIVPNQFPFLEMGLLIPALFGMELILSGRFAGI